MITNFKRKRIGALLLLCLILTGCSGRESDDYSDYEAEEASDYSDTNSITEEASGSSDEDYDDEEASDLSYETDEFADDVTDMVSGIVSSSVGALVSGTVSGISEGIEDIAEEIVYDSDNQTEINRIFGNHKERTATEQFTIKDVTAKSFQTEIGLGNINVSYGKDDNAIVKVKYRATGKKKEVLSKILNTVGIEYSIQKDCLQISAVNKNTKRDIWDWISKEYDNYSLCVELDITLPKGITKFDIDNSLGEINLNSVEGVFNIHSSLGSIDLNDVEFTGKSEIDADLGSIKCSLSKNIKEKAEVTIDNSLGDIHVDTNELYYTIDNKGDSDEYWGGSASRNIVVNKICEMKLDVNLGEITIN